MNFEKRKQQMKAAAKRHEEKKKAQELSLSTWPWKHLEKVML